MDLNFYNETLTPTGAMYRVSYTNPLPTSAIQAVGTGTGTATMNVVATNVYNRLASSAATGSPTVVKASATNLKQFWGLNAGTITYLQLYNKATAPVLGTDTPLLTYPIPASAAFAQSFDTNGAIFSNGLAYAFTTDVAGATAAAAAAVTSFAIMAT